MRLIATTILGLLLTASAFAQGEVRVDEEHMQIGDNARAKLMYSVPAGPAIQLDMTGYKFSLWPKEEPAPDSISVMISDRHQYYIALVPGKTRYLISGDTARPREGMLPFPGFIRGKQVMLAIGKRRYDPARREDVLRVHWLGMVEVR